MNPVNVFEKKYPYDPLTDLQERIRFRNAFAEDARINNEIERAIDDGVLERTSKRVIQEYPFVKRIWELSERYDNDPDSRG